MPDTMTEKSEPAYLLLCYDADGVERPESGATRSDDAVRSVATEQLTDVFLMSHGWQGDIPAARRQYDTWVGTMRRHARGRETMEKKVPDLRTLVIGLHWPSKAWGDEELGGGAFDAMGSGDAGGVMSIESLVEKYASRLGTYSPAADEALRRILTAALDDIAPDTLPPAVADAYSSLDREVGLGAKGEGAAPGEDREVFDAPEIYEAVLEAEDEVAFGGASLGGLLAPLRILTFWQMKRRACKFGESGATDLLRRLQSSVPDGHTVRFHLMGHSFGCIVVSACLAGRFGARPEAVDTLVLVQGAMSLWSFCSRIPSSPDRPGYFHRIVNDCLVRGATITTISEHDRAVGFFYPLGARVRRQVSYAPAELPKYGALGTFGAQGLSLNVATERLHPVDRPYEFKRGTVYNLESSHVIRTGGGASGAHSDICHPEVAHAVWSAMATAT